MSKFSPPKTRLVIRPLGGGDDRVDAAGLVAHLDTEPGGDIDKTIAVHLHAVGETHVFGVGNIQPEAALLVFQRAVGLDLAAIDPVRKIIGDIKQGLIRGKSDPVRTAQAGVHNLLLAVGANEPHPVLSSAGVGGVEIAIVGYEQVVGRKAVGHHRALDVTA